MALIFALVIMNFFLTSPHFDLFISFKTQSIISRTSEIFLKIICRLDLHYVELLEILEFELTNKRGKDIVVVCSKAAIANQSINNRLISCIRHNKKPSFGSPN